MCDELDRIAKVVAYLRHAVPWLASPPTAPLVVIVCGSGLSGLADEIREPLCVPYSSIPGFPRASVAGHGDSLVFGYIGGTRVVAQRGRFHYCKFCRQTLRPPSTHPNPNAQKPLP